MKKKEITENEMKICEFENRILFHRNNINNTFFSCRPLSIAKKSMKIRAFLKFFWVLQNAVYSIYDKNNCMYDAFYMYEMLVK